MPEFEVKNAYRWANWPDRERLTDFSASDPGIDLVAVTNDDKLVAIQCKCYKEEDTVQREDINSFLAVSGSPFNMRWIVTTCKWGRNAEDVINKVKLPVRRIDFHEYDKVQISKRKFKLEKRTPKPRQAEAIKNVVNRFETAERGQLIMACGTGKTYVSLQIIEKMVPKGGRVLFLAPSIALVSQARREWLRYKTRDMHGLVVCSDKTSGGRGENEDIRVSELECFVTTKPEEITSKLNAMKETSVVFCTYQSLKQISQAQQDHGAPDFDMIIADESHRTTGVEKMTGFHLVHDVKQLRGKKRLYMTATPRIYTARSKNMLDAKGHTVYDMDDCGKFGEVMHRLTFKEAVEAGMLSDYRVSVIVTHKDRMAQDLYDKFLLLSTSDQEQERVIKYEDVERLLGTAFAINGITDERGNSEQLPRVLGFANSRKRSKAFKELLNLPELHTIVRNRLGDTQNNITPMHKVEHLDGNSSAIERNDSLRKLERADAKSPRMICNVKLFTEGVDVPSLDAVAFLDPRDSTVDIVQAVGRVMRAAPGKQFGHIIIPVPIKGENLIEELEASPDSWKATGRVLRALQAHDSRLPENPAQFVWISEPPLGPDHSGITIEGIQSQLEFQEISEKFYTTVVPASGLAKPGQQTSDDIESVVNITSGIFIKSNLAEHLANVLGLGIGVEEYRDIDICKIASLLVVNACLLHRRLQDESHMDSLDSLSDVNGSNNPRHVLIKSWKHILEKDYAPVFEPALRVVEALPDTVNIVIHRMVDRANKVAYTLSDLGYDHAGPLYHKILGTAKSDSANYTHNVSALMLTRLAFSNSFTDWNNMDNVKRLRVMDPACGTGTLLMAALKTIKERVGYEKLDKKSRNSIHQWLVEDALCGLDINRHAIQLAACNLTLGAPTVDYKKMNLYTMKHGPQVDGSVCAGSIEILRITNDRDIMKALVQPMKSLDNLQAEHIDEPGQDFPLSGLDAIIMNPPFGNNVARSSKFSNEVKTLMQKKELDIKDELKKRDKVAGEVINSNSISTFFTPLVDRLLDAKKGVLGEVIPTTACTSASGLEGRKFLASRFHVERIITSHDPKHINFSYKTSIHECLMICRRHNGDVRPPTEFISLYTMPKNAGEARNVADDISNGNSKKWGSVCRWPAELVSAGDWTPVQWCNDTIADAVHELETSSMLEKIGSRYTVGPAGQRIHDAYEKCEQNDASAVMIFDSISSVFRRTIHATPESWHRPKQRKVQLAKRYWEQRSVLLVAQRHDTVSGRLTALYSDSATVGKGWIPISVYDKDTAKALAVWLNSTPVRMMLLNRRGKKLTYPKWSLSHLEEIRIPKKSNSGWDILSKTYDETCDVELLPLKDGVEDSTRIIIDKAAAVVLGINPKIIAGWRERLALEPTINNRHVEQK